MRIKKFQDLQVEHPQRYEVTDNTGGENLKTIKFSPGKVYQEGTKETAVIFNNIQKNGLYTVIGTRVIEGTEEIYDVELEGLEEFGIFDINLQLVANAKNTTNSPKLRILSEKYSFANNNGTISIGDIVANNIYIVKINTVKKTAFLMESDKLQKGTYPGNASDLKSDIDKVASTTQLGRIKVGKGMTADSTGQVSIVSENDAIIVQPGYIKLNVYNGVTGTSGIRAASAGAVKTAYDKALEASNNLINKLDKGTYSGNASDLKSEIDKVASTTQLGRIKVGKGMTADSTGQVSIISKNDGIVVNDNDIELNIVDNLTTNSSTRSLSAKQGKKLFDEKQNITDTTLPTASKTITGSIKELFTGKINTTDIVNNLTNTASGKVLDARQGPAIVNKINGLAGGYSGTFPLTTAVKEGIYLLPATNKFYVCVENYSGSSLTAPNANFEELSVFQNRNKLENLSKIKLIFNKKQTTNTGIFTLDDSIEKYKFINIVYAFGGDSTRIAFVSSAVFNTDFLKNNYNTQLTFATTAINPNGVDVTFEHLYVKFINGTQINIEENRATPNGTLSNNKIHQIYAWN